MLVDSHCHLNHLENIPEKLASAKLAGVSHCLNVAVTLEEFPAILKTAENFKNVFASVGVQPSEQVEAEPTLEELVTLGDNQQVLAIGEIGLDYHYQYVDKKTQQQRFRTQICAAKKLQKPIIIHMREATDDMFAILREENISSIGGVMHCFTENWAAAKLALDLNLYISFSGIVTFKNADSLREVAKKIPLQKMLIETDSPYLAPTPFRGKTNQPAYLKYIAECLATVRGCSISKVAEQTTENFFQLFKGDNP